MESTLVASGNARLFVSRPDWIWPAGEKSFGTIGWIQARSQNATGFVQHHSMGIDDDGRIAQCVKVILGYNDMESNQQCADPIKLQNAKIGLMNALIESGRQGLKIASLMQENLMPVEACQNACQDQPDFVPQPVWPINVQNAQTEGLPTHHPHLDIGDWILGAAGAVFIDRFINRITAVVRGALGAFGDQH